MSQEWVPPGTDTTVAHPARMYDFYLGGKDNFPADREAAEKVVAMVPQIPAQARVNRAFLGRAVRYLAEQGIDQFLDIGTGLPSADNTHEVAQRVLPYARVVYVDNDPIVLAHARALMAGHGMGATSVVQADLRDPQSILKHPGVRGALDFDRPIGLILVAVLHFIRDEDDPDAITATLRDALAPGSHLVLSHLTTEMLPEAMRPHEDPVAEVYRSRSTASLSMRPGERVRAFLGDFTLVEPGMVSAARWRPADPAARFSPELDSFYGAVARKD